METTPDIIEVKALEYYQLYLKFSNGEEKMYDMKEKIEKIKYFNKLKNRKYFENVKPRGDTVEWENGEDIAPENLYYESIPIKK
jgi:Holliday junction resolvase